jgi:hypothetical protein
MWLAASGCDLGLQPYVDPVDAGDSVVTDSGTGATKDVQVPDSGSREPDASPNPTSDAGDAGARKRIFVTSTTFTGSSIGGVTGANAKCQEVAKSANLGGTFIAWLSVTNDSVYARLQNVGPWYLIDGTLVFANKGVITSLGPYVPIDRDETGTKLPGPQNYVWSGTLASGQAANGNLNCNGFSVGPAADGLVGDVSKQTADWTAFGSSPCNSALHLYCIEQ